LAALLPIAERRIGRAILFHLFVHGDDGRMGVVSGSKTVPKTGDVRQVNGLRSTNYELAKKFGADHVSVVAIHSVSHALVAEQLRTVADAVVTHAEHLQ
jgi:hypothetical protein